MGNIFTLLTVLFVALKLIGVIDWSWFTVFSPLLVGVGMAIMLVLAGVLSGGKRGDKW